MSSFALVLHGKLGGWKLSATESDASKRNASSLRQQNFARFTQASLWRHVVRANRESGARLTVVLHTWNPELGTLLDELYQPAASAHEPSLPVDKVASQHLSIQRGLALLSSLRGPRPALVMVSRLDLLLFSDVRLDTLLARLPTAQPVLILPHHCVPSRSRLAAELSAVDSRVRKRACNGGADPAGALVTLGGRLGEAALARRPHALHKRSAPTHIASTLAAGPRCTVCRHFGAICGNAEP
eukprot:7109683-Prymnesium_polylepis.1